LLGVTDTGDRVAQTAAAMLLEEKLEPVFHRDSYGYRPNAMGFRYLGVNASFPVVVTVGSSWLRACRGPACRAG